MAESWRSAIRTSAFVRKELVETLRQPRLVAALVLAPFLILLLFGAGLRDTDPSLVTVFVVPEDDRLAAEVERFATEPSFRLQVRAITPDREEALARLRSGEVDLVVVLPEDPAETVRENRRATVMLYHDLIDPIESRALGLATRAAVNRLNQLVLRSWVADSQERAGEAEERLAQARGRVDALEEAVDADNEAAVIVQRELLQRDLVALAALVGDAGLLRPDDLRLRGDQDGEQSESLTELARGLDELSTDADAGREEVRRIARDLDELERALAEFQELSPETLVDPFQGSLRRLATVQVALTDFFAPGVLVLLLQHMLVTLVALSVVRDDALGATELFRVSPLRTGEVMAGKYLSYLGLAAVVSVLLTGLLVVGLGVPLAGSTVALVLSIGAILFTAIGMGFVVALAARTDSQAVQYAMLLLLASIFLTGFIISLERVLPSVRTIAWMLPPTYGIALLRDVMLRGVPASLRLLGGLTAIGLMLLAVSWLLLRRRLKPTGGHRPEG